jgi:hypothetical protein
MLRSYYAGMKPISLSPMFRQRTRYNPSTKIKDCVAQQILFALISAMYPAQLGTLQLLMYLRPASVLHILDARDPRRRSLPHSWSISDIYAKYMNNSRKLREWHRNKLPKPLLVILYNSPGILLQKCAQLTDAKNERLRCVLVNHPCELAHCLSSLAIQLSPSNCGHLLLFLSYSVGCRRESRGVWDEL